MSSAVPLPLPLSLCCLTQTAAEVPGHWHLPPAHSHHTHPPPCDIKGSLTKPRTTEVRSPSRSRPGSGRSVLKQHCPLLRSPNGSCVWSGPFLLLHIFPFLLAVLLSHLPWRFRLKSTRIVFWQTTTLTDPPLFYWHKHMCLTCFQ